MKLCKRGLFVFAGLRSVGRLRVASDRNSRLTLSFVFYASFLAAIPRVLADVYHSLGSQLPEALLALLPADFFSDESVSKDSVSPSAPSAGRSVNSLGSCAGNQLQSLRDRPAHQRRWGGS